MNIALRVFLSFVLACFLLPDAVQATPTFALQEQTADDAPGTQEPEGPKAYSDVITEDAVTDEGVFGVHRVDETLYFEIPDSLLGRDMLLVTRIAKVPVGFPGYSPAGVKTGEQVLRWERRGDRVLLRTVGRCARDLDFRRSEQLRADRRGVRRRGRGRRGWLGGDRRDRLL